LSVVASDREPFWVDLLCDAVAISSLLWSRHPPPPPPSRRSPHLSTTASVPGARFGNKVVSLLVFVHQRCLPLDHSSCLFINLRQRLQQHSSVTGCSSSFNSLNDPPSTNIACEWACSPMIGRSSGTLPTRVQILVLAPFPGFI
jgi:hypothetical protein